MKSKFAILFALFLSSQTSTLLAYPGESIVLDTNGDYIITYWNGTSIKQTRHIPATKIEPTVKSVFKLDDGGLITYRYTVSNAQNAKQSIVTIGLGGLTRIFSNQPMILPSSGMTVEAAVAAAQSLSAPIVKPDKWNGRVGRDPKNDSATQVSWLFFTDVHPNEMLIGVMPGSKQQSFGFAGLDLPGISNMRMRGNTPIQQGYEDEGPVPDSAIISQLDQIERNNFVLLNAAAPMIAVPSPFDAAVTLERIQANTHTWIGMKLLDATFSSQLDRSLTAAANAYRHNQNKAGKEHLQAVRLLLKKAYADLENEDIVDEETRNNRGAQFKNGMIARLAARVLDFNVKYVLKRLDEK